MAPKLPTTTLMLHKVLQDFTSRSGFSLIAIRQAMEQKFQFNFSKRRYSILKKCVLKMLEDGELNKKTGVGLVGKFKRVIHKRRNQNLMSTTQVNQVAQHQRPTNANNVQNSMFQTPSVINEDSELQYEHVIFAPLRKQLFENTTESFDDGIQLQSPRSSLAYKRKLRNKRTKGPPMENTTVYNIYDLH